MRLAKQKRRCPNCGAQLTGLVRKIEVAGRPQQWGELHQTEWLCEQCDTEWVQLANRGMIPAEQAEQEADEEVKP